MSSDRHRLTRLQRTFVATRVGILLSACLTAVLIIGPSTAFSQATPTPTAPEATTTPQPDATTTPQTTPQTTPAAQASLTFSVPEAAPGVSLTVTGEGFRAGETVQVTFNGTQVGSATADPEGNVSVTFNVPTLSAGEYEVEATGQDSDTTVTESFRVLSSTTSPQPTAVPTVSPVPAAPPVEHDERYFAQTGFRVDNDQVWSFYQAFGGTGAFGFPVSRTITFLGCPVQIFQRHIIQVCPNQGPAIINLLDPEIFPYTTVNGSVFPAPDDAMKNATPQVSDPDYSQRIIPFVQANVPDDWNGRSVEFFQTFNDRGGLTIWGAPISNPQPDPTNPNFVYQRFQRGIMHFTAPNTTEAILLADYLKAIMTDQNVPQDLAQQSRESRFANQYCPGAPQWLCRPGDLAGTDLTFAFVTG
jgi:hypothetical protein